MLQQTRVETVIPYYHEFLRRYPTVAALAAADESEVLKLWQGLGYYSRARNLHRAAQVVAERHGGQIPDDADAFAALPGVGPYTVGAVMSIAFGKKLPAVDGNVLRVMARFLGIEQPIQSISVRRQVADVVKDWLAQTDPASLTQALMELGALVCVPRNPRCAQCPLQSECFAYARGMTAVLPVRAQKGPRRVTAVIALWCEDERGIVLEQRPSQGLLAGMWQLPAIEADRPAADLGTAEVEALARRKYQELLADGGVNQNVGGRPSDKVEGTGDGPSEKVANVTHGHRDDSVGAWSSDVMVAESGPLEFALVGRERHIFSHIEWEVAVYRPLGGPALPKDLPAPYRFARLDDLQPFALPRVYEKLLQSIPGK
jgi:A/G-specific adenine glycosylase